MTRAVWTVPRTHDGGATCGRRGATWTHIPDGGVTWRLTRGPGGIRSVVTHLPGGTGASLARIGDAGWVAGGRGQIAKWLTR